MNDGRIGSFLACQRACVGAAVVYVQSYNVVFGQLAGAMAAVMGVFIVVAAVRRNFELVVGMAPVFAVMLSGAYWVMSKCGITLDERVGLAAYLLTLIGTTLPVAWTAALVYRMARVFELSRPWRAGLATASVFGTGLLSYATVLNAHARPTAAITPPLLRTRSALWTAAAALVVLALISRPVELPPDAVLAAG